jgi:hypothetical protein
MKSKVKLSFGLMFSAILSAATVQASTNIFNDAVFWFRGGKDGVTADGKMQTGEFFDALHANDSAHAHHQLPVKGYLENAQFVNEDVVFPALGLSVTQNVQVLKIRDVTNTVDGTDYRWPLAINAKGVIAGNKISDRYTIIARLRLERLETIDWLFAVGYDGGNNRGLLLGFNKISDQEKYPHCKRISIYRADSASATCAGWDFTDLRVETNRWFDLSVTVGDGKVRMGIATSDAVVFKEKNMWTDNCSILTSDNCYRFFAESAYNEERGTQAANKASTGNFEGCVQQLAIWDRSFTDDEVMEAFGMPRPTVFRTGLENGAANEFGGVRGGSSQTIEGLGSWHDLTYSMLDGDVWTVNFPVLDSESESRGPQAPYVFSLRSLPDSAPSALSVVLNGTSLGTRWVGANAKAFWPVPVNLLVEGRNTLTVRSSVRGSEAFNVDSMEFGGALSVGWQNGSSTEIASAVAGKKGSSAYPNPKQWWNTLQSYDGKNDMSFRVWVDPALKDTCSSTLKLRSKCLDRGGAAKISGNEFYEILVNGEKKAERGCETSFTDTVVNFAAGELKAGWNEIKLTTQAYGTCYWQIDYYRFWTELSEGFAEPEYVPGFILLVQ